MPDGTRGPGAACFAVTCDPVLWLCTTQDGSRHGGKEFAPAAETELEAKTEAKAEAEAEVPVKKVKIHAMPMSMNCVGAIMLADVAECGGLEMCATTAKHRVSYSPNKPNYCSDHSRVHIVQMQGL